MPARSRRYAMARTSYLAAAPRSGARCGAPCSYIASHESALIALTPHVKSSWASVKARFGSSDTAATSPSGPYSVSMTGWAGPSQVTTARFSVLSVTCAGLAGLMRDGGLVLFSELCGVSAGVCFRADCVCSTPRNRRASAVAIESEPDPKEKSAVSEEAEHWPLNAAREASQDRGQSCPPWPVRHVPIGRSRRAPGPVSGNPAAGR